jgi:hypothetical protein
MLGASRRYASCRSTRDGDDCGYVDYVQWDKDTAPGPSSSLADALDTGLDVVTAGDADWDDTSSPCYYDRDAAESGDIGDSQVCDMQTWVDGAGTLTFYWKVSSEEGCDYLEFYIDNVRIYNQAVKPQYTTPMWHANQGQQLKL